MQLNFVEIKAESDFKYYESFAVNIMDPEDFVSADELREMIANEEGKAWFVHVAAFSEPVAWCSISYNTISEIPGSVHVLGIGVSANHAHQGIGKSVLNWLIENNTTHVLTAAIKPENYSSSKLFKSAGFTNFGKQRAIPWDIWVKD